MKRKTIWMLILSVAFTSVAFANEISNKFEKSKTGQRPMMETPEGSSRCGPEQDVVKNAESDANKSQNFGSSGSGLQF